MNILMFLVGFVIFTAYVAFLMWNIFYSAKKNREENYPGYYTRHNQPDNMDLDGMGNFSRFPKTRSSTRFVKMKKEEVE